MKNISRLILVILTIAVLLLTACAKAPSASKKVSPSKTEPIEGTTLKRVILTEKAAERLDIQTVTVSSGQVDRKQVVGGEVVTNPLIPDTASSETSVVSNSDEIWVQISLNRSDLTKLDLAESALVVPVDVDDQDIGLEADVQDILGENQEGTEDRTRNVYYVIKGKENRLEPGQRVGVQLPMLGNGVKRIIVPYSAVIYDQTGEAWVYTNPQPLVFVRHRIVIDYIEGEQAFLVVGPPSGTTIVTVGAAELFGAETGVSK